MAAQTYYLKTGVIKIGDHFSFVDGETLFEVMEKAAKKAAHDTGKTEFAGEIYISIRDLSSETFKKWDGEEWKE